MELTLVNQITSVVIVSSVVFLCLYLLFSFFELFYSAERGQGVRGRLRNLSITVVHFVIGMTVSLWVSSFFHFDTKEVAGGDWVHNTLLIMLFIFVKDFFFYWYHRAQHRITFLWPIHEIHHADTELNVTSSYRTYWLELPIQSLVVSVPVALIVGNFVDLFFVSYLTILAWEFFTHANLRLNMSFLSPVLCGPQVHRIHHSTKKEHRDKNFAQHFPIFDVIFGTYYAPAKNEFPPTGSRGLAVDASQDSVMLHPLSAWIKMFKSRKKIRN